MPFLDYVGTGAVTAGAHFRGKFTTGATIGLTAAQPWGSLRWTDASHLFIPIKIRCYASLTVAFGTAQLIDAEAIIARNFTVVDSGGTSQLPFAGDSQKMRAAGGGVGMNGTLISDFRMSTTGTLTAGTRTLDSFGFGYAMFGNSNALGNSGGETLYELTPRTSHPVVLGFNEGIIFRTPTAQGATGTVTYTLVMEWVESPSYVG